MPLLYDIHDGPVLIRPGQTGVNDLRFHSVPVSPFTHGDKSVSMIGSKTVSFANVFATQPWVAAAVMRLMTMAIRVPLKVYRRTGDDSRERLAYNDHPLAAAVVTPWEKGSQAQLIMAMLGPLLIHGNGLTRLDQGRSGALRFDPVDWRYAEPVQAIRSAIAGWKITDDFNDDTVPADEVLHMAWWSPLGPLGVSPLQQLGITLNIEDAAQRYQSALFANGARPPSAITASEEFLGLQPGERSELLSNLREDVNALYSGPENQGRPALLPPGLDWKPVGHTAVEAALIDQRKVAREEIAAVYQMPPPLIGILDRATYSNIETQREMGYTDSLAPPLVLIEQTLNAHLVRGVLREDDIFVEFDFAGVLRGDRLKEVQALREAIDGGLMTRNEGRSVLNMPRSDQEGMDEFTYQANNSAPVGNQSQPAPEEEDPDANVAEPAAKFQSRRDQAGQFSRVDTNDGPEAPDVAAPKGMRPAKPDERKALRVPPAWTDVVIAEEPPPAKLKAMGRDKKGRTQRMYSVEHSEAQAAEKFARIRGMDAAMPRVDTALRKQAMTDDTAAAMMLIRKMGLRPGSTADTGADKQAYGASTLLQRHVTVDGSTVKLAFTGKKGVDIDLEIKDPELARVLKARQTNDPDGRLFDTSEKKMRDWTSKVAPGFKVKDFRTRLATAEATNIVNGMDAPSTPAALKKARNQVGDQIAAMLGNTRVMALGSYIDPSVFGPWEALFHEAAAA